MQQREIVLIVQLSPKHCLYKWGSVMGQCIICFLHLGTYKNGAETQEMGGASAAAASQATLW